MLDRFGEAFLECFCKLSREFLRASDDEMEACELGRLSLAEVAAEKRGCRDEDGDVVLLDELDVPGGIERIWKGDQPDPFNKRVPEGDGAAKGVEEGKASENGVPAGEIEHAGELGDVPKDIAMAEDDALWLARAAAGKEDHRFLAIAHGGRVREEGEDAPGEAEYEDAPEDDLFPERRQYLLDMKGALGPRKVLEALNHRGSGDDLLDAGDADGGLDGSATGGEVEIHGHLACEHDARVCNDSSAAWREDDRDPLAGDVLPDVKGEDDAGCQQGAAGGDRAVHAINKRRVELMALQPAQTCLSEVAAKDGAMLVGEVSQDEEAFADEGDSGLPGGDGSAEDDGDRIGNAARYFPEIFAAMEGEDGAPELIHPDRDDGSAGLASDQLEAALQAEQGAGAGELALRENADDLAGANEVGSCTDGLLCMPGGDGDGFDEPEQPVEGGLAVDRIEDEEADGAGRSDLEDNGVDPGDVIWQEEEARLREGLGSIRADAVNDAAKEFCKPQEGTFVLLCHGERGHKSRMQGESQERAEAVGQAGSGARPALALLLGINLFCYLDRYILAAVIPAIKHEFLRGDPNANGNAGLLTTVFLVSYMLTAPVFGWMADRYSRWKIIGISVALWSVACGATGLAGTFTALLATRVFLGVGEAGYGPAAPTIISDFYPIARRGRVLAWFFMAIPVGSALGYAFGGWMNGVLGWRWAFYLVLPPGLLLAGLCFLMNEPAREHGAGRKASWEDYAGLIRIPSLVTNIIAQTALTFAIGGLSVWAPTYISEARGQPLGKTDLIFGGILVVAGFSSTLFGGWLGDALRKRYPGSYFIVSGFGMLLGFPCTIAMLYTPFPLAWVFVFLAIFFLFMNTGPANTALANVTPAPMRATAFAMNILVIHLFGDALSPWLIGWIKDHGTWNAGFFTVSTVMLVAGVVWLCSAGALVRDTENAERAAV